MNYAVHAIKVRSIAHVRRLLIFYGRRDVFVGGLLRPKSPPEQIVSKRSIESARELFDGQRLRGGLPVFHTRVSISQKLSANFPPGMWGASMWEEAKVAARSLAAESRCAVRCGAGD